MRPVAYSNDYENHICLTVSNSFVVHKLTFIEMICLIGLTRVCLKILKLSPLKIQIN